MVNAHNIVIVLNRELNEPRKASQAYKVVQFCMMIGKLTFNNNALVSVCFKISFSISKYKQ